MARVSYADLIRTSLINAGDKGIVVADLFKELKSDGRTSATYNSFARFWHWYKKLGYVEKTGEFEPSKTKGNGGKEGVLLQNRVYYRIAGPGLTQLDWTDPLSIKHPEWKSTGSRRMEYMEEYRKTEVGVTRKRGRPRISERETKKE